ncbi:MAG: hypothetical protein EOP48_06655 [Sphingobacteriales bacterium]|nr:MAG: hypothetical protein EOP48_06655 [Sphingobacteriales bacterium]
MRKQRLTFRSATTLVVMYLRNEFYVVFNDNASDSFLIKHIQYNIHHKIWLLKYNKYRRINIEIGIGDDKISAFDISWNDRKTANISAFCKREFVANPEARISIAFIYDLVFKSMEILWQENGWNVEDLISIHKEIKSEDYKAIIPMKTTLRLPDRRGRVSIVCNLNPRFTEYFFRVENKTEVRTILFFRGISDLGIFFDYFCKFRIKDNDSVVLSGFEGELNHVLNLTHFEYQRIYAPRITNLGYCQKIMEAFESADPKEILRVMKSET